VKSPFGPLPTSATYPAGDAVACVVICAVASEAPSAYYDQDEYSWPRQGADRAGISAPTPNAPSSAAEPHHNTGPLGFVSFTPGAP
jgi:hypothetical protein